MPKLLVVAEDKSGDAQASYLYSRMAAKISGLEAIGFGGADMEAAGIKLWENHYLAHHGAMGFTTPLKQVPQYAKLIGDFYFLLKREKPDAVLFVQNPGINFILAKLAMDENIPRLLYFPPEIWAWGPRFYGDRRIEKVLERFSYIISCFDYEHAMYTSYATRLKYPTGKLIFEGHPFVDIVGPTSAGPNLQRMLDESSESIYVSLLPGSREHEIKLILPRMLKVAARLAKRFRNLSFFLPAASVEIEESIREKTRTADFPLFVVSHADRYAAIAVSKVALATSGTVTLETLCLGVPTVIVYDAYLLNKLALALDFVRIRTEFIGLPNILAGKEICPEVIGPEFTEDAVLNKATQYLEDDDHRNATRARMEGYRSRLGEPGVLDRIVERITKELDLL